MPNKRPPVCCFFIFIHPSKFYLDQLFTYFSKYFLFACTKIDDLNTIIPVSKFWQLNMKKQLENMSKKYIYWQYRTFEIHIVNVSSSYFVFACSYSFLNLYFKNVFRFSVPPINKDPFSRLLNIWKIYSQT